MQELMRAVVLGSGGQLGRCLLDTAPAAFEVTALDRASLDITDHAGIRAMLQALRPAVVINAAAYTAVDQAEDDAERAFAVNEIAAGELASSCESMGARLLHVSTDFVFDGASSRPYRPDDPTHPLGAYGRSKLAGEVAVRAANPASIIVRTSWLYSEYGHNFVLTMLRLMKAGGPLRVVGDQTGSPTYARGLANVLWRLAASGEQGGILHWCDEGQTSWHGFAGQVAEAALAHGTLAMRPTIQQITSGEFETRAKRPAYSVLDCSDLRAMLPGEQRPWADNLRLMMARTNAAVA